MEGAHEVGLNEKVGSVNIVNHKAVKKGRPK